MLSLKIHGHICPKILAKSSGSTRWIAGEDEHGNEATLFLEPEQVAEIGAKLDQWREEIRQERVAIKGPSNGFEGATISAESLIQVLIEEEQEAGEGSADEDATR